MQTIGLPLTIESKAYSGTVQASCWIAPWCCSTIACWATPSQSSAGRSGRGCCRGWTSESSEWAPLRVLVVLSLLKLLVLGHLTRYCSFCQTLPQQHSLFSPAAGALPSRWGCCPCTRMRR